MIAAIQTHGELLHWQPHVHALVTCGAFTGEGEFLEVPKLDLERGESFQQFSNIVGKSIVTAPANQEQTDP